VKENITSSDINDLILQAKKKYRKQTKIQCPEFNKETLHLNASFWTHLELQKNKRQRSFRDIITRLKALDKMYYIINHIPFYQDYYKGKDHNTIIHFWTLLATIEDVRYCVVVRKRGKQGNKHIYSIIPNWQGYIPRKTSDEHKIKIL